MNKKKSTTASKKTADSTVNSSAPHVSRDISWLAFNERVLAQTHDLTKNILQRLRFLAISASNLDEFFMIRIGNLYNYMDYKKKKGQSPGMKRAALLQKLLVQSQEFYQAQQKIYLTQLLPRLEEEGAQVIQSISTLTRKEQLQLECYFDEILFPMLTPIALAHEQSFPVLMNRVLAFGVITQLPDQKQVQEKLSFVQLPANLPRFFELPCSKGDPLCFVPIEEIIRVHIGKLFRNVNIQSVTLLRITRNGDFSFEESDDIETKLLEELRKKLKTRKTGQVVRLEMEAANDPNLVTQLKNRWDISDQNIFVVPARSLIDLTAIYQILQHSDFKDQLPSPPNPIPPLTYASSNTENLFEVLKRQDILLHHPYNSFDWTLHLLEQAAEDEEVLAIKITLYRVASQSAIIEALIKAAENGKHVTVLIELKARFDEENNIKKAERLRKAGCFVAYSPSHIKTHAKLFFIVRKEQESTMRYVHMSSGNYNEDTAKSYTDVALMTTDSRYADEVSDFFNVITGHSFPKPYKQLITAPTSMRKQLSTFIDKEIKNAQKGLPSGIVIKLNSLEDEQMIDALYEASQAGVPIELIVRGICCLVPRKKGWSETVTVRSIIGDFLEHARIFYFHQQGHPAVYVGSADIMVRSFERRIESLFIIRDKILKQQVIHILAYNLRDDINTYLMQEDGSYIKRKSQGKKPFSLQKAFFNITLEEVLEAELFSNV